MAIADTISSMYENVGEVYDTITNVDLPTNKNIENIPSTIRKSYLDIMNNGIDTIYDNWEKVNGTGTSISLNNTEEAPMTIEYKGNTSQETTTGQNLLPNNQTTQTINGVTFTMNSDKSISIKGTPTENTDYYFVGTSSEYEDFGLTTGTYNLNGCTGGSEQTYMLFTVMNRNGNIYYYNNTYAGGRSMIVETGDKFRIFIRVISGKNVNTTIYPQINVGSTALSYEPYTNGATPRPTYPQDIHIVSGDNYIDICGKNLIVRPYSDTTKTTGNLVWTLNDDGTILVNGTNNTGSTKYFEVVSGNAPRPIHLVPGTYTASLGVSSSVRCTIANYYNNAEVIATISANSNKKTFTITETKDVSFVLAVNNSLSVNNALISPQIEVGSTATTYEEYKGASYPIDLKGNNLFKGTLYNGIINQGGTYISNTSRITNADSSTMKTFILEKGTYTLSIENIDACTIVIKNESGSVIQEFADSWKTLPYTFTTTNDGYFYFSAKKNNDNTLTPSDYKAMLNKGTTALHYEDNWEIELCKIGTYQDRIFKSSGKNLFNPATETKNYIVNSEGTLTPNNSYNSSAFIPMQPLTNVVLSTDQTSAILEIVEYDTNQSLINRGVKTNSTFYNLKTSNTTAYIRISYENTSTKVQFEKGSTATTYEPYGKDWYLNKQIGKVVLDGSEAWAKGSARPFYTLVKSDVMELSSASSNATLICNYLQASKPNAIWSSNINGITNLDDGNAIRIRIKDDPYDITTFKQWLGTTKPIVYYVLATPTYEKITGELLNQLEAIKNSYENQTNINQENNDLPFELEVGALEKY